MVRNYKRKTERGSYGSERLTAALAAVEGGMPLKTAATEFDIPPRSLRRHRDNKVSQPGTVTMGKTRSVLPDYIENELHDHIQFMEKRLYCLTTSDVRKLAFEVAEKANVENPFNKESRMAGKDWRMGFFSRHQDLRLREPEGTSVARAVGFNRPKVREFFTVYKEVLNTVSPVRPSTIWNMDETGISNVQKPVNIIATKGCRQVGKMTSAELVITVTVICAMSAVGVYLPPMFIFPRKRMIDTLLNGAPPQSIGFSSPKGWTDSDLFLKWLEHFVRFTNCSTQVPQIVILDGHHSHKSLQAILYVREHGVHLITLPPHITHKLQPLDKTYFKSLKSAYNAQADSWMISYPGKRISSYEMAGIFAKAFLKTATPEKAVRGFETCGIWPFNEHVFSDDDFCAAEVTEEVQPIGQNLNEPPQPNEPPVVNINQSSQGHIDMNYELVQVNQYPDTINNGLPQSNQCPTAMNIEVPLLNQPPTFINNALTKPSLPSTTLHNELPLPNRSPTIMYNEPPLQNDVVEKERSQISQHSCSMNNQIPKPNRSLFSLNNGQPQSNLPPYSMNFEIFHPNHASNSMNNQQPKSTQTPQAMHNEQAQPNQGPVLLNVVRKK